MLSNPLLEAARCDLGFASFGVNSGDDGFVGSAGFHVQQAVENTLKASLAYYGVEYKKTHDITSLLQMVSKTEDWIPEELWDELELSAPLLTSWKSRQRYGETGPYLIAVRTVAKQLKLATELHWVAVKLFEESKVSENAPTPTLKLMQLE